MARTDTSCWFYSNTILFCAHSLRCDLLEGRLSSPTAFGRDLSVRFLLFYLFLGLLSGCGFKTISNCKKDEPVAIHIAGCGTPSCALFDRSFWCRSANIGAYSECSGLCLSLG